MSTVTQEQLDLVESELRNTIEETNVELKEYTDNKVGLLETQLDTALKTYTDVQVQAVKIHAEDLIDAADQSTRDFINETTENVLNLAKEYARNLVGNSVCCMPRCGCTGDGSGDGSGDGTGGGTGDSGSISVRSVALYIAVDVSGSMTATRMASAKLALNTILDEYRGLPTDVNVDIMLVAWAATATSIMYRSVNDSNLDEMQIWVNNLTASGGTSFDVGVADAPAFFLGAAQTMPRYIIFITDGVPTASTVAPAKAIVESIAGVKSFAFNIEETDITHTQELDNTPGDGVPVLSGSDAEPIRAALTSAINTW